MNSRFGLSSLFPLFLTLITPAGAAIYSNNFEVNSPANWTTNSTPGVDSSANFFFDYSSVGIPAAPSGSGTHGLKLQANLTSGVFGGVSVSPVGVTLPAQYILKFDLWANFNGPLATGGNGSTQLSTFGVGTVGTTPQTASSGSGLNSAMFGVTGDGGATSDWRAYSSAATSGYADNSGVFAAGTGVESTNASNSYYASFGGVAAPSTQSALYPQQSGTTMVGAAGMEWHQVVITKGPTSIVWSVDGIVIATLDPSSITMGGTNFFLGQSDINSASSTDLNDVNLLFTLIDNVTVDPVPEPGAIALLGASGLLAFIRRRRA